MCSASLKLETADGAHTSFLLYNGYRDLISWKGGTSYILDAVVDDIKACSDAVQHRFCHCCIKGLSCPTVASLFHGDFFFFRELLQCLQKYGISSSFALYSALTTAFAHRWPVLHHLELQVRHELGRTLHGNWRGGTITQANTTANEHMAWEYLC